MASLYQTEFVFTLHFHSSWCTSVHEVYYAEDCGAHERNDGAAKRNGGSKEPPNKEQLSIAAPAQDGKKTEEGAGQHDEPYKERLIIAGLRHGVKNVFLLRRQFFLLVRIVRI